MFFVSDAFLHRTFHRGRNFSRNRQVTDWVREMRAWHETATVYTDWPITLLDPHENCQCARQRPPRHRRPTTQHPATGRQERPTGHRHTPEKRCGASGRIARPTAATHARPTPSKARHRIGNESSSAIHGTRL